MAGVGGETAMSEGHGRSCKGLEGHRRSWTWKDKVGLGRSSKVMDLEGHGGPWKVIGGHGGVGRWHQVIEGHGRREAWGGRGEKAHLVRRGGDERDVDDNDECGAAEDEEKGED